MNRDKSDVAREVIYSPTIVDRLAGLTGVDAPVVERVVTALRATIDRCWDDELTHARTGRTPT